MIVDLFYPVVRKIAPGIDPMAAISESASVDQTAGIGPFCQIGNHASVGANSQLLGQVYVGNKVTIGSDCLIYPGVTIMDGCQIGNRVTLHPGVVIGSDGFGFAPTATGLRKIQQIGWVEIADEVEIGSNTTIDCGAIGPTRIGRGTKIDNLVQIAHNVQIGEHSIIVSQVGISGSTTIGNGCVLAGQVGVVGHIHIGDGVVVAAQSGISKSVKAGQTVFGSPAREIMDGKRIEVSLRRLPDLLKRVKKIETKLDE
jgi:UDP-3-O-[3-hydroxymyristoyl] glucosamine N-acyltransferase